MPQVDLPLDQLRRYRGTNPKPDDFDEYWADALQELGNVPCDLERHRAEFQIPGYSCSDWFFSGTRGARIHAKCVMPETTAASQTAFPAVIRFHGYSGNAGDWAALLPYAAAGFVAVAMDVRGQGGLSTDPGGTIGNTLHGHIIRGLDGKPEDLMFRHVFLDTVRLAQLVIDVPEVDASRVGVFGRSQGGALTLACAALEPRILRAAPVYPFLIDYQRVWELDLGSGAYQEIRDYFRLFDPSHRREAEVFTRLGYIDLQHLASRIHAEVLMFTGLMDQVCPPSTQFAAYNNIAGRKEIIIYPDFAHEDIPGVEDRTIQFMLGMGR